MVHMQEKQIAIMQDCCRQYRTSAIAITVWDLLQGDVNGRHIAELLFHSNI